MSIWLFLFAALVIAIWALRKASFDPSLPKLDQTGTLQLKGLAILLVIMSHLINLKIIKAPYFLKFSGAWGVAIFLLVSGYGLVQSYLRDGIDSNYLNRRFNKVLLPYILVTGLLILVDTVLTSNNYNFKKVVLLLAGLDVSYSIDPTMWFVTFILAWYAIFYLVFRLPTGDFTKVGLLFIFSYIFKDYASTINGSRAVWQWSLHVYVFPIGVLIGLLYRRIGLVLSSSAIISIFSIIGAISAYTFSRFVEKSLPNVDYYSYSNLSFALFAFCIFTIARYTKFESSFLSFVGALSYEIYLLEWILMAKYPIPKLFSDPYLGIGIFLAVLISASILLKQISIAVAECVNSRCSGSFINSYAEKMPIIKERFSNFRSSKRLDFDENEETAEIVNK